MSQMAQRLFQGDSPAQPQNVDIRPRHDHHTEIDLAAIGEELVRSARPRKATWCFPSAAWRARSCGANCTSSSPSARTIRCRLDPFQDPPMPLTLVSRTALVTGASRGIGKAIALALAEAGANVAVNYHVRKAEAEDTVKAIQGLGRKAAAFQADVSSAKAVADLIRRTVAGLGPIDILVNNAGIAVRRSLEDLSEDDFDRTLAVNLKSAFLCTQAVFAGMRQRGWGRIINISSGAARGAGLVGAHYNASKAGMEGLTRGYAARLAKDGVTVNAVSPSLIETEMIADHRKESVARIPVGRLGTSEEVAAVVVMVAANAYMTGQTVQVNGGLHFN
jgi:3-oxoacyl-[acyl-carrier protein] reductase